MSLSGISSLQIGLELDGLMVFKSLSVKRVVNVVIVWNDWIESYR